MLQQRTPSSDDVKDPHHRPPQPRAIPIFLLKLFPLFLLLALSFSLISVYMARQIGADGLVASAASALRLSVVPCAVGTGEQPEGGDLQRWSRPPASLAHSMSDEELLWRASLEPQVKSYPFRRVPKVAFMFLIRGPLPLSPLWEWFFKGHQELYSIYVHTLPSYRYNFTADSVFYRRLIPSKVTEWGRMSMCDAERRLLANALLDFSNEWFVLLSESCIPLHNFSITYKYLKNSNYSFLGVIDDPGPYGRGRYNPNMAPEVNITQWRKGSQWFEVNRKLAISIIKDTTYYPKFEQFCKPNCYVDEHYFPTMLTIESAKLLANRSITWVDWSRGGAHPATFGRADITKDFFKRILEGQNCSYNHQSSSICHLFARKFSPSSLEPLLHLAPTVLGFG